MKKIKKGDPVIVTVGKYKGAVSVVMKVEGEKVWVKGVNVVKKAKKGEGFVEKVMPIHISNVMYYDKDQKISSRIGIKVVDGKKRRFLKKTGKILDN